MPICSIIHPSFPVNCSVVTSALLSFPRPRASRFLLHERLYTQEDILQQCRTSDADIYQSARNFKITTVFTPSPSTLVSNNQGPGSHAIEEARNMANREVKDGVYTSVRSFYPLLLEISTNIHYLTQKPVLSHLPKLSPERITWFIIHSCICSTYLFVEC